MGGTTIAAWVPVTATLAFVLMVYLQGVGGATFTIQNQCSFTVWAAGIPVGGGQALAQGQTWTVEVPAGTSAGRFWGRTGCSFDASGQGSCTTGNCGGVLECTGAGQPPATLAEYTLNGANNLDTYDISPLRWGGDPSIILAVQTLGPTLPIQLKDLQVYTVVRVIFQLAENIPCISAVVVALLSEPKPKIDYTLKAIGGSLTAMPGLSDMIDDTVESIVSDTLQWPHRIVVPIGGVPVDTSELELKPQGRLKVTVVRANSLKNMEMIGKSDPYVVLYVRVLFKVKTKVVDNNLNPEWNESFDLDVEDKETQALVLEVFDKDDVGEDKKLGVVKCPLVDLEPEKLKDLTLSLLPSLDTLKVRDKKNRGTIDIKLHYHEYNKEEQLAALEEEKKILDARKTLKEAGIIGSTVDALDGAVSLVGSGVGLVGTGLGAVGSGIGKASRFMGKNISNQFGQSSKRNNKPLLENGNAK